MIAAAGVGAGESIKAQEAGAVAVPTAAAGEEPSNLTSKKQTAADFNAEQIPLSSFILNGVDYTAARSVKVATLVPSAQLFTVVVTCKLQSLHAFDTCEQKDSEGLL